MLFTYYCKIVKLYKYIRFLINLMKNPSSLLPLKVHLILNSLGLSLRLKS
jgi:hypothetical protein